MSEFYQRWKDNQRRHDEEMHSTSYQRSAENRRSRVIDISCAYCYDAFRTKNREKFLEF